MPRATTRALAMLERDVNNLTTTLGRFAPELLDTEYAREMWALFEQGELQPDSELTGLFAFDETAVDPDSVMLVIDDAREEAISASCAWPASRLPKPSRDGVMIRRPCRSSRCRT